MARPFPAVLLLSLALACGAGAAFADEEGHSEDAAHEGEHGAARGEHGSQEMNWAYGFIGEKEGVEPDLLYRPKGMPPPFLANVVNFGVLLAIILAAGKKPIAGALRKRKERIVAGMEEAGKMKDAAASRLAEYEEKLAHVDQEIERIRREMQEGAEADRRRIQAETAERRDRMEKDAKLLVEQELKAAREALVKETVAGALRSAEELLAKELGATDQDRMAREYLDMIQKAPLPTTVTRGPA